MRLLPQASKVSMPSLGSDLGSWDTLKLKKEKRKKTEAIRPCEKLKQNTEPFGHFGASSSEGKTHRREDFCLRGESVCEEIGRNIVRVKKKKETFFLCSSYI